jgi:hypothetical protein
VPRLVAAGAEAHRRFVVTAEAGVEVFRKATRYITISGIQIGECAELTNIDAPIDYVSEMYGQPKRMANRTQRPTPDCLTARS